MRTRPLGVVPTGIQFDVSPSAARVTVAPGGSLRKVCICAMSGQNRLRAESPVARASASVASANAESSWSASMRRWIAGTAVSCTQRARRSRTMKSAANATTANAVAPTTMSVRRREAESPASGAAIARSSARSAAAVCGRSPGSIARQRATSRTSAAGADAHLGASDGAAFPSFCAMTCCSVPENGGTPAHISWSIAPRA